ncbi:hypothetical protein F4677DRAFT_464641 [Hypoxylon crocopeplum]|nr:hypothetical protein F4677DRAFT_464641 [Hypoxylon crocopeplum]
MDTIDDQELAYRKAIAAKGRTPLPEAPSVRRKAALRPPTPSSAASHGDASPEPSIPSPVNSSSAASEPALREALNAPIIQYGGVYGYDITINGEVRFFCVDCQRDYKHSLKNLSSHYNHVHDPTSSFARMRAPFSSPISCLEDNCEARFGKKQDIVDHYRQCHGLIGKSKDVLSRYGY